MSDKALRYMVKWKDAGGTHYGIYRKPTKGKPGVYDVDDAVMPYYHEVPEKDLVDIDHGEYDFKRGCFKDELSEFVNDAYKAADKLSNSLPEGIRVGKLFSVGVADGSAWYVVTKVGKTTAKIEWRGFCPDRYTDQVLGLGGTFPLSVLKRLGVGRKPLFGSFP